MSSIFNDIKIAYQDSRNPVMRFIIYNALVFLFIALTSIVFFLFNTANPIREFILNQFAVPASIPSLLKKPWSLFTYQFLHERIFHILFNMLVLYWFGNLIVEYLGKKKFIYLYLIGGVFGGLLYILFFNLFPIFQNSIATSRALGASASIMAIVFAAATLLPNYSIVLAIFGAIRLKYIAAFYLLIDLIGISSDNSGGHIAHLGGALLGFLFIKLLQNGTDIAEIIDKPIQKIGNIFNRKKTIKVSYRNNGSTNRNNNSNPSQEIIDKILDKISKSGYESLNATEKEQLFKASNK